MKANLKFNYWEYQIPYAVIALHSIALSSFLLSWIVWYGLNPVKNNFWFIIFQLYLIPFVWLCVVILQIILYSKVLQLTLLWWKILTLQCYLFKSFSLRSVSLAQIPECDSDTHFLTVGTSFKKVIFYNHQKLLLAHPLMLPI